MIHAVLVTRRTLWSRRNRRFYVNLVIGKFRVPFLPSLELLGWFGEAQFREYFLYPHCRPIMCGYKSDCSHLSSATLSVQIMPRPGRSACLTALALLFIPTAASPNFVQCLARFKELNITVGGTDYDGRPVINPQDAVGLTYTACVQHCSPGQESFDWTAFSQQFSAWLIPWLALVSQLPFGAKSRIDNLISGEFPCSIHRVVVPIFLLQYPSCTHCRVSHPRGVLARSYSHQYPLGQRPFLRNQVPQPREGCQGSHPPPTSPTLSKHP